MRIINAPSLANCSFLELPNQVRELKEGGADWFHIDIMDGHYVPNLCFPLRIIGELKREYPEITSDVHLMVTDPMSYIGRLVEEGADYASFHLDSTSFPRRALRDIREKGMKAGVVLNPGQPVSLLDPLVDFVDYIVLMTVEPGFAGQRFMPESVSRLAELADLRSKHGSSFLISIDGGVDMENALRCAKLGAEVYVTGIYTVFNQPEGIAESCKRFKKALELVNQN